MPSFQSLAYSVLLATPLLNFASAQIGGHCPLPIDSSHNPIGKKTKYNRYASTGTVNGSYAILPVAYSLARSMVPSQYPILTEQYQQWLPSLGADQYPLLLAMDLFHDIYKKGVAQGASADFQRAGVMFPFVDRLNDGYTAMMYSSKVVISNTNAAAQAQYQTYSSGVSSGYFADCNAYEYENATANLALPPAQRGIDQAAWADTNTNLGNPSLAYRFVPASSGYSIDFWHNVTNQPLFGDQTPYCDNVVRLPSTTVTTGKNAPVNLSGDAAVLKAFFNPAKKTTWSNVTAIKLDQAYYEKPKALCTALKGFTVVSAPAS